MPLSSSDNVDAFLTWLAAPSTAAATSSPASISQLAHHISPISRSSSHSHAQPPPHTHAHPHHSYSHSHAHAHSPHTSSASYFSHMGGAGTTSSSTSRREGMSAGASRIEHAKSIARLKELARSPLDDMARPLLGPARGSSSPTTNGSNSSTPAANSTTNGTTYNGDMNGSSSSQPAPSRSAYDREGTTGDVGMGTPKGNSEPKPRTKFNTEATVSA